MLEAFGYERNVHVISRRSRPGETDGQAKPEANGQAQQFSMQDHLISPVTIASLTNGKTPYQQHRPVTLSL
jgi:hypothetical protein